MRHHRDEAAFESADFAFDMELAFALADQRFRDWLGSSLIVAGASTRLTVLTPWGGTAFIAGWVALLVAALVPRSRR